MYPSSFNTLFVEEGVSFVRLHQVWPMEKRERHGRKSHMKLADRCNIRENELYNVNKKFTVSSRKRGK